MPSLLQQHVSEFTQALISRQQHDDEFINRISDASKISPRLAVEIYRNNTHGARVNTLELVYPACKNILGEEAFDAIAREFALVDDAGAADLNQYGEAFSIHLGGLVDAARLPADYAYLQDLASLEYLYHAAYYAAADPQFDFELFEQKVNDGEPLFLQPCASLGLLQSRHPVHEIWQLNHGDSSAEPASSHAVQALQATQYLLVYRDEYRPLVVTVTETEYSLLQAFRQQRSLQWVVDHIHCDIDVLLPALIAKRWIVGVLRNG